MKLHPRRNRILVEIDDSPEIIAGGIEIVELPDRDGDPKVKPLRGTVLKIGPEVCDIKVGDYVVLNKYHGVVVHETGHVLIKEAFVMAVIGGEDET
jgi:co-chaperonin GroES (HSP10)